ncbi:MAG: electron transport complex subunit RsxB [Proteobacteria bacterium]|nr:MAG: electron transport complex subunit RsxB [Pseudomonadota bacterium]
MSILLSIGALLLLAVCFGLLLGFASVRFRVEGNPVVDQIDSLLPQTQCGQCGHPGCRPYAEAIAAGEAINRCPPGGQATIDALAALLDVEPVPLDEEHGEEKEPHVAVIREDECIGCTKCIQACPVDAILGAAKQMHTVIADECTGCDLCVAPCPVDCIDMVPVKKSINDWIWPLPDTSVQTDSSPQINTSTRIIATDKQPANDSTEDAA